MIAAEIAQIEQERVTNEREQETGTGSRNSRTRCGTVEDCCYYACSSGRDERVRVRVRVHGCVVYAAVRIGWECFLNIRCPGGALGQGLTYCKYQQHAAAVIALGVVAGMRQGYGRHGARGAGLFKPVDECQLTTVDPLHFRMNPQAPALSVTLQV